MQSLKLLIVFFLGTVFGASIFLIINKPDTALDSAYSISKTAASVLTQNKSGAIKNDPRAEDAKAKVWAVRAISESLSFNFDNHEETLTRTKILFTPQGWSEFDAALKKARLIERVEENKLTVRTQPKSFPKLISSEEVGGVQKWVIQISASSRFMQEQKATQSDATITLTLVRIQNAASTEGLAIEHWDGMPQ